MISYARQTIDRADIRAVSAALRAAYLTQGPGVAKFEAAVAAHCGARYAVAVSSGTAGLHLACLALGLARGDRHWTSPNSFVASANCGVYCGSRPDFVDIDLQTYNLDLNALADKLKRTRRPPRVIIPVHFAGLPCDMPAIRQLADKYGCLVLEDAAHALGASYRHRGRWHNVGACAHSDAAVFSFHAVKNIATGEGGMIVTNRRTLYERLLRLRTHGITRQTGGGRLPYYYEMRELGFNYRLTDIQCALGLSQLRRLKQFNRQRANLVQRYREQLTAAIRWQEIPAGYRSAHHLFVVRMADRDRAYRTLQAAGVAANLHYIPIYRQPYYRRRYGFRPAQFPQCEQYYREALTLPLYPNLTEGEQDRVMRVVKRSANMAGNDFGK